MTFTHPPGPPDRAARSQRADDLLPLGDWYRHHSLRSWPVLLFLLLICVPAIALFIVGTRATPTTFDAAAWIFAAALPVLVVALIYRQLHGLQPRDYLFVGAVSGLVFGASEVVRYFTVNGVAEFYQTVQASIPSITRLIQTGHSAASSVFAALIGSVLYFVLDFVWRFVTDPISHACWSGLSGYFIGLAVTRRYRWYQVAWIGLAVAAVLHGFNDWARVNGHLAWILVVAVSGILFLGYAKVGSRHDLRLAEAVAPSFLLPHGEQPLHEPDRPAGPWWEH